MPEPARILLLLQQQQGEKKKTTETNPQLNVPSAGMKHYTDTENNNLLCQLDPELYLAGTRRQGERSCCNEAPWEYKDRDNCSFVSLHINLTNFCYRKFKHYFTN